MQTTSYVRGKTKTCHVISDTGCERELATVMRTKTPLVLQSTWSKKMRYGRNQETQVPFLIGVNYGAGFEKIISLVKPEFKGFLNPENISSS